jgi:metallo-beta-lactamase class B
MRQRRGAIVPASVLAVFVGAAITAAQQGPPGGAPPPADSPEVKAHVEAARKAAGDEWAEAFAFYCAQDQRTANRPDDPVIRPTQIFDNLYAIGRTSTIVYAIKTPEGVILIDAGYQSDVEPVLLAGMRELGLDPASIRHVIVTHGHADHFGGAKYLQDTYGARVWVTETDWASMERPPAPGRTATPIPRRDMVMAEGQAISLGGQTVTPVSLPGHTPGTVALIFGVADRGTPHVAGLLGAPILIPPPDPQLQQHLNSLQHFADVARTMNVDVELLNHPLMDGTSGKLTRLQARAPNGPNPFVIGWSSYQRFLTATTECLRGVLGRRADAARAAKS